MIYSQVVQRGTRASQPAATAVTTGTLYYVTDESVMERSNGTTWHDVSAASALANDSVTYAKMQNVSAASRVIGRGSAGGSGDPEEISLGTSQAMSATTIKTYRTFGITVDGGGSAVTTGVKGYVRVPWTCTITKVSIYADVSGSCVADLWKDSYANYPPTVADTITASAKPTLSSAIKNEDSTLTGWTTSITAGDFVGFNIDSATTVTRVHILVEVLV